MKVKYRIHPGEYAIGENEKFYADQAAKGWFLEKRGGRLSKFRKGDPAQLKYRIELSASSLFLAEADEIAMPEAQVALYEDCGWTLVTHRGLVHVFSAPEESDAPEFYSEPEQQAQTLKALRRSYRVSWLIVVAAMAFIAMMTLSMHSGEDIAGELWAEFVMKLIQTTALAPFYFFWLGWGIYQLIYGGVRTRLLYCRLKRGEPLDHSPKTKHWGHRLATGFFAAGMALSVLLTLVQLAGTKTREMPFVSDGPYLVLADLGVEGERTAGFHDDGSTVETSRSLIASMWNTGEYVSNNPDGFGNWAHMDQKVYCLPTPELAMAAAPSVMRAGSIFGYSFEQIEVEGLDGAWYNDLECIAVRDRWVWYVVLIDSGDRVGPETVFNALAALAETL